MRGSKRYLFLTSAALLGIVTACPPGALQGLDNDDCYQYHFKEGSWQAAEDRCSSDGGHLVSVRNATINEFLLKVANVTSNGGYLGLGGKSLGGNDWEWSDGAPWCYTNWAEALAVMQLYNHWMMHGEQEATAAGNPKPPPPEVYLEWVLEAWYDGVTKDNVVNSFKTCGITTALDGKARKKREEEEAADLAELMAGFELDLDEDDVDNVSDAEIVDDPRENGNNNAESESSGDSEF